MIGAPNEQRLFSIVIEEQRRRVAVVVFVRDLEIARLLPLHFAGVFVKGGEKRFTAMHTGENDVFVGQHRRSARVPEKIFTSIFLDEVYVPSDVAIEIERGEVAALEINENALPIGHWRSVGARSQRAM